MKKTILALAISAVSFGSVASLGSDIPEGDVKWKAAIISNVDTPANSKIKVGSPSPSGVATVTIGKNTYQYKDGQLYTDPADPTGSKVYFHYDENGLQTIEADGTVVEVVATPEKFEEVLRNESAEKAYTYKGSYEGLSDTDKEQVKSYLDTNGVNDQAKDRIAEHVEQLVREGNGERIKQKIRDLVQDGDAERIKQVIREYVQGDNVSVDTKVKLANNMFSNQGNGTAEIAMNKDGHALLTYTDPSTGNQNTVNLSTASDEQLDYMKQAAHERIQSGLPSIQPPVDGNLPPILEDGTPIVDPIEGEKPLPTEGQKIVEGLQEKVAELKGEYKGELAKKSKEEIEEAVQKLVESGELTKEQLQEATQNLINSGTVAKAQGQTQAAQQQAQIDEIYAQGQTNANDIQTLFGEVDRLDTRIDQTQALNAATVNARPMVTNGATAFGAGVGYSNGESALAIGVAHSFEESAWSVSGTVAATSDDVVLGAGTQYTF